MNKKDELKLRLDITALYTKIRDLFLENGINEDNTSILAGAVMHIFINSKLIKSFYPKVYQRGLEEYVNQGAENKTP